MNLNNLSGLEANSGATEVELAKLESDFGMSLPLLYKQLLRLADGFFLDNGLHIYSSSYVMERNHAFEVAEYSPGYISIGDDSGGQSLLIPIVGDGVFLVDNGSMRVDDFRQIGRSLSEWVDAGCPMDNESSL